MAETVLNITLETLRDLLLGEAKFLSDVSDQVVELQKELVWMKSFLKEADRRQHKEEIVRQWIREVKDLCYQVEDVLETYTLNIASKRSGNWLNRAGKSIVNFPKMVIETHRVGNEIARIKTQVSNLSSKLQTYGIQRLPEGESSKEDDEKQWWVRQTYSHEADDHFVGMQDEIKKLVPLIVAKNHKVVSIYGMGGKGKTTLARKLYHHEKVKSNFEVFAWHCVSQKCDPKVVLQDILRQLSPQRKEEVIQMSNNDLVRELNEFQRRKKCLVVLDDVWQTTHWDMLKEAFPIADQAASSKILLTTRKEDVAKIGIKHELRFLTEEEAWQLLQKIAFSAQEEKDGERKQEFEEVGKELVRNCGNLPLAVSAVGGILKDKNDPSDWQMVCKDIDSYLGREDGNKEAVQTIHVLGLSYDDLPFNLKSCFLYMGIFQEDEEIDATHLYHLWIAEGMVPSEQSLKGETLMDVAERNLNELASRCMVQVQMDNLSTIRRIKSCKLHDLMREFCLKKGKEERFLENLSIDDQRGSSSFGEKGARRLAVSFGWCQGKLGILPSLCFDGSQGKLGILPLEEISNQSLRTLYVRRGILRGSPEFRLCRVLVFSECKFEEDLPEAICKMVHLRYLSVHDSILKQLPAFIGDLPFLETLDLRTDFGMGEILLPNVFMKMKRLRHLYLPRNYSTQETLRLNGLSQLVSLFGFRSELFRHTDLSDLINLRYFDAKLGNDDWSQVIDQIDTWTEPEWVKIEIGEESLKQADFGKLLRCRNLKGLHIKGLQIGKLPEYDCQFWPNLVMLWLWDTQIHRVNRFTQKTSLLEATLSTIPCLYGN